MARIHGRNGVLYAALTGGGSAENIAFLNSWSLNNTSDKVDVTSFGDSNKTYVAGLPDSSGSYSGFYNDASDGLYDAALDGVARKFYIYPSSSDTGEYFYGTAFFDFNVESNVDGAVTISGDFAAATDIIKVST